MNDQPVLPDPISFGRTALELNPRWTGEGFASAGCEGFDVLSIELRTKELRKKLRKRLRRLEKRLARNKAEVALIRGESKCDGILLHGCLHCLGEAAAGDKLARLLAHTGINVLAIGGEPGATGSPKIVGIVNVTPDSFSDGGNFLDPTQAIEHGLQLVSDGADALDVGGESTRPGSEPVSSEVESARIVPVIAGLRAAGVVIPISIDTQKASVAAAALEAGATWINDVSAGRTDPDLLTLVAERQCDLTLMHMQGTPRDMQQDPRYDDVVDEVLGFLRERVAACLKAGIDLSRISIDPGIGFGKSLEHNLELLRRLPELRSLGLPLYLGVSRKSFIAHVNEAAGILHDPFGQLEGHGATERVGGTAAAITACVIGGANWLRVHDVRVMGEAARVAAALHGTSRTDEES